MKVIKLIGTASGEPTPQDGKYLLDYVPPRMDNFGHYRPGGRLLVTADRSKALHFPSMQEAMECWRQSAGLRPDGKPNRPLTAWSVEITEV